MMVRARWFMTALSLGLVAGYVWYARRDFAELLSQLEAAAFCALILPLVVVAASAAGFNGSISRTLLARFGVVLSFREAYALALLNSFVNLTPVPQAGAMARGVYLRRVYDVDYSSYAATLAVTYVSSLTLTGAAGLVALGVLSLIERDAAWQLWLGFTLVASTGVLFNPWAARLPLPKRLAGFRQGLDQLRGQRLLARVIVLQLALIAVAATGLWLAAKALAPTEPIGWLDALVMGLVSMVAAVVNLLGTEQAAAMICALLLGIDPHLGLAASALLRLITIGVVLCLGPLAVRELERQSAHRRSTAAQG